MKYYNEEIKDIFKELNTSKEGLTSVEAKNRQEKNGKNKLEEKKSTSFFQKLIKEIINPMNIVLIVTAIISSITTIYEMSQSGGGSILDFVDVFIIVFVVLVNAILGVLQESKAEKSLQALKSISKASCRVIRDNQVININEEDLVVGDIVILEAGSVVPADGRIIEAASLQIEEAILTGESVASNKDINVINSKEDIPLGDRHNMAYMGTSVTYGRGKLLITNIGMETEMGKIAKALNTDDNEKTPLQKKLNELSKILTFVVIGISIIILIISIVRALCINNLTFHTFLNAFMVAISLAVAAIPEGLVTVVTIVLSLGVTIMSKKKAVIRKLTAVETLGCTQIICSDKTGTLTQNKMTVVESYSYNKDLLAKAMSLCTDAEVNSNNLVNGEPTEVALVEFALKQNINKTILEKTLPRVNELPFDSNRKMMSTLHQEQNEFYQYTKGGLDCLLPKCNKILLENGIEDLTEEKVQEIYKINNEYSSKALRVLACAYKKTSSKDDISEDDLIFVGLVGMINPVRPEVKKAVEKCKKAGIQVVMITGDHKDTATAIGLELGIISSKEQAMTGLEMEKLSDEQFEKVIEHVFVYARVQPEHKTRIVNTWKKKVK